MKPRSVMSAAILSYIGAVLIAANSALFGVGMARLIWADDLKHAQRIDKIRSKTEDYLRNQIESMQRQLDSRK